MSESKDNLEPLCGLSEITEKSDLIFCGAGDESFENNQSENTVAIESVSNLTDLPSNDEENYYFITTQPISISTEDEVAQQEDDNHNITEVISDGNGNTSSVSVDVVMHDHYNLAKHTSSSVSVCYENILLGSDEEMQESTQFLKFDNENLIQIVASNGGGGCSLIQPESLTPASTQPLGWPSGYQFVSLPASLSNLIASSVISHESSIATVSEKMTTASTKNSEEICLVDTEDAEKGQRDLHGGDRNFNNNGKRKSRDAPTVTVQTQEGSLIMQRFFYQKGLCRICLLEKEDTTNVFENVTLTDKGCIENQKGPQTVNYNIIPAIKTLLDIDISDGDGLPDIICSECLDNLVAFANFRKKIARSQARLKDVIKQVMNSSHPTFIPPLGEKDFRNTNIFKHPDSIIEAKEFVKNSKFSHLVRRNLSDRVWDKMFATMSLALGIKSDKLKPLEKYSYSTPYVDGWFCSKCNFIVQGSKDVFVQHCQDMHDISFSAVMFPCDICGLCFPFEDTTGLKFSYGQHWLNHFFFHRCNLCSKRLPSYKALSSHKRSTHQVVDKIHACSECDKKFGRKTHLEAHVRTHLNQNENDQLHCPQCDKRLRDVVSLKKHLKTVHSDKRLWICDICGKSYKQKEILNIHRNKIHLNIVVEKTAHPDPIRSTGEKNFACEECGARFYKTSALKSHAIKHKPKGDLMCPEPDCGKLFKRKVNLKEHVLMHSDNVKPHVCNICGKHIRMKCNLFKHMKIHQRHKDKATVIASE